MSHFTTEVRYICENYSPTETNIETIVENAIPHIFDNYPIFDEAYRSVLNKKIIKHFYTQEIGYETYGLWKFKLNVKLNEIMPYYNQLYRSELLEFNPLYDVDLSTTRRIDDVGLHNSTEDRSVTANKNVTSSNSGETTSNNESSIDQTRTRNSEDAYSDTPQGTLERIRNQTYLSEGRIITESDNNEENNTASGTVNTTANYIEDNGETRSEGVNKNYVVNNLEDYVEKVSGKKGIKSYSELLTEFRSTMMNIDMMVIDELSELFMLLWE